MIASRRAALAVLAAAALLAAAPAHARVQVTDKDGGLSVTGKAELRVDADKMRHDDVRVAKGEVQRGDVVTSGSIDVEGEVDGSCVSFGGRVDVPGTVRGDVVALGGSLGLSGSAAKDVAAIGGPVTVSGKVGGDLAAIGGDVALAQGAVVDGDLSVVGGRLSKETGAVVRGQISQVGLGALASLVPALARGGSRLARDREQVSAAGRALGAAAFLAFAVGTGLVLGLLALFLPQETRGAAAAIRGDFWRAAGIGTLMVVLFLPALVALAVSILGIPLIPFALLAWCAATLFGLAAFSHVLAERAAESLGRPLPAAPLAVGAGWLLLELLPFCGKLVGGFLGGTFAFAGFLLLSCGVVTGLGAVWLTQFGRRLS
jgi:cytoskeletal protein CcmA (bactofilin family)